jgi:hypothetical protein
MQGGSRAAQQREIQNGDCCFFFERRIEESQPYPKKAAEGGRDGIVGSRTSAHSN